MVRKNRVKRLIIVVIMIFVVLLLQIQPSLAQTVNLTIAPITWNVIGLDSNNVAVGPDTFPVGARVCNTGSEPATNVVSTLVWDSSNAYIDFVPGSLTTITASSLNAGSCVDFYYNVRIIRTTAAYNTTRRYHITATADGVGTISTPTPRELFVEHLVSQNRNSIISIVGPTTVFVGQTYTYIVTSDTSTNGYEQLESFINFPNIIFRIEAVTVTYGVGPDGTTLYADACGWINDPTSPDYRSCTTTGKVGGIVVTTYTVRILSTGQANMSALIYDFSGSSYHYNGDFDDAASRIIVNAYDPPTIAKSFSPNPVVVGQVSTLTLTLINPNPANLPPLTGIAFTDSLPSTPGQMVVATPPNASTTGCGTPTFNPLAGATILNFSGGTLTAGVTCVISVDITVPTAGNYVNTTSPLTPGGATASATLTAQVPTTYSMSLEKAAQLDMTVVPPDNIANVGDTINYTLTATNTGNGFLTGVTISDPSLGTLVCTPAQPATLAPGASLTCTSSHTLTQADIDAGFVSNTASADSDQTAPTSASVTIIIPQSPALSIIKSAIPTTYTVVGQTINYTYQLTNIGNVTLIGPFIVIDDRAIVTCPVTASLAPGAYILCTASYTITQADLDIGSVTNMAFALGGGVGTGLVSTTVYAIQNPALTLVKTAVETSFSTVGDILHFTVTATNTGNVTLTAVSISDPLLPDLSCIPAQPATLAPGAALVCTGTHVVTQADLNAGSFYNAASATATPPTGPAITPTTDITVPAAQTPALTLVKTAQETTFTAVGDILHFTVTATNTGNVTLTAVSISDPLLPDLSCTPTQPATLEPGAALVCTGTHVVTQADLNAGSFYNAASATATPPTGPAITPTTDITVPGAQTPALTLVKTAVETSFSTVGDILHFTITATNTGNVTLTAVSISDPLLPDLSCTPTQPATLIPSASLVCTGTHVVTQADLNTGSFYNAASATATPPTGQAITPTTEITVPAAQGPALTLVKTAQETTFTAVGDILHFTVTATNTGNVTLTAVSISDPLLTNLTCTPTQPATLEPGAALVCTGTHVVTQADLNAGSFYNTAGATATPPTGPVLTPTTEITVPGSQKPAISLVKIANPVVYSTVGQTIVYTYTITNIGNVTLAGPFTVTDNKAAVTCNPVPPGGLVPNATLTCTAKYLITQADLDNKSVTNLAIAAGNNLASNQASSTVRRPTLPAKLPETGFAPGHPTLLSVQPAELKYADLGDFWLEIPALNVKAPIVGVPIGQDSWQLDWLGDQIGYLEGTAYPTWKGNSVLTGHVYDAFGQPGPFINLRNLRWGQQVIVHGWGQSYIFEIRSVQSWVDPDNTSIITHEEKPWLTLITCQSYDEESDSYRWRVVARAVLIKIE